MSTRSRWSSRCCLACLSGTLWATLDDDLRDIVLEPGDSWIVPVGKRCLLYALDAAELRIEPLQAPRPRRRRSPWGLPAWRPFLPRLV